MSAQQQLQHVLVADDEHLVAVGLANDLRGLGLKVVGPVADGQSAIELAESELPDLALLDIAMPVMNGLEAAAALWSTHGIPSVIVSAYSTDEFVDLAKETGVFGYLLKPVTAESLKVCLHVAWSRAMEHESMGQTVERLEKSLAARRVIEQAKWRLVEGRGLTEPSAHAALQRVARASRTSLANIAQRVLDGEELPLAQA